MSDKTPYVSNEIVIEPDGTITVTETRYGEGHDVETCRLRVRAEQLDESRDYWMRLSDAWMQRSDAVEGALRDLCANGATVMVAGGADAVLVSDVLGALDAPSEDTDDE